MPRLLSICFLIASTSAFAQRGPVPSGEPKGVELEVRQAYARFVDAWNRHDVDAMAAQWTEHGDYMEPDGRTVFGQDEVRKLLTYEHASVFKNSELHLVVERVRQVGDDVALADGSYELFGATDELGKKIATRSGYLSIVLVKKDGAWKVSASRLMLPQALIWRKR